jgi:hypothetical protein
MFRSPIKFTEEELERSGSRSFQSLADYNAYGPLLSEPVNSITVDQDGEKL